MKKKVYVIREVIGNGNTYYHAKQNWEWRIKDILLQNFFESRQEAEDAFVSLKTVSSKYHSSPQFIEVFEVNIEVDIDMLFDSIESLIKEIKEMLDITNNNHYQ